MLAPEAKAYGSRSTVSSQMPLFADILENYWFEAIYDRCSFRWDPFQSRFHLFLLLSVSLTVQWKIMQFVPAMTVALPGFSNWASCSVQSEIDTAQGNIWFTLMRDKRTCYAWLSSRDGGWGMVCSDSAARLHIREEIHWLTGIAALKSHT